MGSSSWSDDFYKDRAADRSAKGTDAFDYDRAVKSTPISDHKVHDALNPKGVVRESRDSKEHPESNAIAVMFDVTGSMGGIPRELNTKLPDLMGLLLRKGYIKDPQILFGCVGDYFADKAPLQVGQFESGIEMDDDFTKFFLEGGGGGSMQESYNNALYFFAHKTSIDCYEKRTKKGYLFLIGDEHPYGKSTKAEIEKIIGDQLQSDMSVEEIVAEVKKRYNLFFIIPRGASHGRDTGLESGWKALIGSQNVIMLDNPSGVCEAIGLAIGMCEGTAEFDKIKDELNHADAGLVKAVGTALSPLAASLALTTTGTGSLPEAASRSETTKRL